jgi:hypothetical protein
MADLEIDDRIVIAAMDLPMFWRESAQRSSAAHA